MGIQPHFSCVELGRKGETSAALFENRKNLVGGKEGSDYEVPLSKGPSSRTPVSPLLFAKHSILNVWHCSYSVLCFFQVYAGRQEYNTARICILFSVFVLFD